MDEHRLPSRFDWKRLYSMSGGMIRDESLRMRRQMIHWEAGYGVGGRMAVTEDGDEWSRRQGVA